MRVKTQEKLKVSQSRKEEKVGSHAAKIIHSNRNGWGKYL